MSTRSYQDLEVWQESMEFVIACYDASKAFPSHENYGLTSQLRRSAVSVPSNIAEGQGRFHTRDFVRHLSIAYGSLMEAETQLRIALRLGYITSPNLASLLESSRRIGRMLNGLRKVLSQTLE